MGKETLATGPWEAQIMAEARRYLRRYTPVYPADTKATLGNRGCYFQRQIRIGLAQPLILFLKTLQFLQLIHAHSTVLSTIGRLSVQSHRSAGLHPDAASLVPSEH